MIYYSPVDGDVRAEPVEWRPQTAFVMQQLGRPLPAVLKPARKQINASLRRRGFKAIDAQSLSTGRDYLAKIWNIALGCPVGIAVVHAGIAPETMANIYFELGIMQAYGRDTVVVKVGPVRLPSDLTRTEHIASGRGFRERIDQFMDSLAARTDYYLTLAGNVEKNPLLAIDYLRRAYLLNGNRTLSKQAQGILAAAGLGDRALSSVERLMVAF